MSTIHLNIGNKRKRDPGKEKGNRKNLQWVVNKARGINEEKRLGWSMAIKHFRDACEEDILLESAAAKRDSLVMLVNVPLLAHQHDT